MGRSRVQYLAMCREFGVDLKDVKLGDELSVDLKYLRRAIAIISELGLKLVQVVWRKLQPDQIDEAATSLNEVGFELISQRRYQLAGKMLHFGLHTMKKHGSEQTRKMMVVNYANSEKLAGRKEKALEILNTEDWSAVSDQFRICVSAVKDDVPSVLALLETVAHANQVRKQEFRDWPVFYPLKDNAEFAVKFEKVFGEPFFTDRESVEKGASPKIDAGAVNLTEGPDQLDSTSERNGKSVH